LVDQLLIHGHQTETSDYSLSEDWKLARPRDRMRIRRAQKKTARNMRAAFLKLESGVRVRDQPTAT
jgi:hypothetical protein